VRGVVTSSVVGLIAVVGAFAAGVYVGEDSTGGDPAAKAFEPVPATSGPIYGLGGGEIEPRCYVFATDSLFLYFDPDDPDSFCVHPLGGPDRGRPGGGAQIPKGCTVAQNETVYCDSAGYPPREVLDHWLEGLEYASLKHRLKASHAAVEAALIEARRRVRINEGRES